MERIVLSLPGLTRRKANRVAPMNIKIMKRPRIFSSDPPSWTPSSLSSINNVKNRKGKASVIQYPIEELRSAPNGLRKSSVKMRVNPPPNKPAAPKPATIFNNHLNRVFPLAC